MRMEQAKRLVKTPVVVPADGDYCYHVYACRKLEVRAPGIEGLYFAGDTARGFGVAMDCACSTGINCAAAILARSIGIE